MSQWITYARLQHALRDLSELERNITPRLKLLEQQLALCGAIVESYEIENIRRYIWRMLADAYTQIQHHNAAILPGITAPPTTPLHHQPVHLLLATEDTPRTS